MDFFDTILLCLIDGRDVEKREVSFVRLMQLTLPLGVVGQTFGSVGVGFATFYEIDYTATPDIQQTM